MHCMQKHHGRQGLLIALVAPAATLSACATGQGGTSPATMPSAADGTGATSSSGRLEVYVTDQNGRPLDRATVDVSSDTGYRRSSYTDGSGKTTFSNVPEVVNVSVTHQLGAYSAAFIVAQSGTSEMRMIVNTMEVEEPEPQADQGGGGGGGGFY
jgi:FlaG/FlaF family flagellin (archaellin)